MASTLLGNPLASGAQIIASGNVFSGVLGIEGGIQLRVHPNASGYVYIGLSGNLTLLSGGFYLSGTLGVTDGMVMGPGDSYFIPRSKFPNSGLMNIYAVADVACSGQTRIFWEKF